MDIYQKRKMRQEKVKNEKNKRRWEYEELHTLS